jgi:two-component system, response regulator PdtaR
MNTKTVVVAEDEPLIRLLVAGAMRDAGFEVIEAGHAEEALGHLQSQPATIHLLFTDIHMPGQMTGLALACYVREAWPHIALLITSGQMPAEELPAGSIFLTKPYETEHVVAHARALTGTTGAAGHLCLKWISLPHRRIDLMSKWRQRALLCSRSQILEETMGRGILLWLLGVPIPIIIILALIWH